jgi:hypothetical protein
LGLEADPASIKRGYDVTAAMAGAMRKESPGVVFSRFLSYLRYCELEAKPGTPIEMSWFAL